MHCKPSGTDGLRLAQRVGVQRYEMTCDQALYALRMICETYDRTAVVQPCDHLSCAAAMLGGRV